MPLPRPARPTVLWKDLRAFWAGRPRHQWIAGTLAVLIPMGILVSFYFDAQTNVRPVRTVIYVNSWPADRSDEQIKAQQEADAAALKARQEARQRQFQRIDSQLNRLGI
jgi:hypothetical protein